MKLRKLDMDEANSRIAWAMFIAAFAFWCIANLFAYIVFPELIAIHSTHGKSDGFISTNILLLGTFLYVVLLPSFIMLLIEFGLRSILPNFSKRQAIGYSLMFFSSFFFAAASFIFLVASINDVFPYLLAVIFLLISILAILFLIFGFIFEIIFTAESFNIQA